MALGKGKESGIGLINATYVIQDGPHKGRNVFDTISFSPKSLWRVKGFLAALEALDTELPVEKGADGVHIVTDEDQMYSALCEAALGKEMMVNISEVPENKEKGFKAKNNVDSYEQADKKTKWDS